MLRRFRKPQANARRPTGLMVGLNRRFAPMVAAMKEAIPVSGAKQMIYRVNSGPIPTTTWLHTSDEGGGMLVGEMCHFVDLMQFICGERPMRVHAQSLRVDNKLISDHDNVTIVVGFDGGSVGTLCYNTVGDKAAPKERLEVYGGGVAAVLDDFRLLEVVQQGKRWRKTAVNQDKGQARQIEETVQTFAEQGRAPIHFEQLVATMQVIFGARQSLFTSQPVALPLYRLEVSAKV